VGCRRRYEDPTDRRGWRHRALGRWPPVGCGPGRSTDPNTSRPQRANVGYGPSVPSATTRQVTDRAIGPEGVASATFDPTRTYRYRLTRTWDPNGPRVNFLMLNPSTADAFELDPTVRRCVGFARTWGFGSLEVTNIFAFRATDPTVLVAQPDPVGADNDRAILDAARMADRLVAAWGVRGSHRGRDHEVVDLLADIAVRPVALRVTKQGHPAHPLYIAGDTVPHAWVGS